MSKVPFVVARLSRGGTERLDKHVFADTYTPPADNSSPDKYVYSQANLIFVIPSILPLQGLDKYLLLCRVSNAVFLFRRGLSRRKGKGKHCWRRKQEWISKRWIESRAERKRYSGEVADKVRGRWRECAAREKEERCSREADREREIGIASSTHSSPG